MTPAPAPQTQGAPGPVTGWTVASGATTTTPPRSATDAARPQGWTPAPAGAAAVPARAASGLSPTAIGIVIVAVLALVVLGGLGLALGAANPGVISDNRSAGPVDGTPNVAVGGGDDQIRANTQALARAIEQYAGTYGVGPSWDEVNSSGGVAQFLDPWPTNPITGSPMESVTAPSPGDYKYQTAIRMPSGEYDGYVTGYLSDGSAYSVEFKY